MHSVLPDQESIYTTPLSIIGRHRIPLSSIEKTRAYSLKGHIIDNLSLSLVSTDEDDG